MPDNCPFGPDNERTVDGAKWIACVEKDIKQIQEEVEEMHQTMTKYMEETRKDLTSIKTQQSKWLGGIAVICFFVPLAIRFLF